MRQVIAGLALLTCFGCSRTQSVDDPSNGAVRQSEAKGAADANSRNRRSDIRDRIYGGGELRPGDIQFLEEQASDEASDVKASAFLLLGTLSTRGQYDADKLLQQVETATINGEGLEPTLYAKNYAAVLMFPIGEASMVAKSSYLRAQNGDPSILTQTEKSAVTEFLARDDPSTVALAGEVFVRKADLSQKDREWVLSRTKSQVGKSKENYKKYWEFVQRVVEKRNKL